jgi:3-hydroxyisobutyrate dehydrogenase-like beta-hydroxyacid dehydrogenase
VAEDPPAANLVKLSINFLLGAAVEGLAEASALVRKAGIDLQRYVDIVTSSVFPAPAYEIYGRIIAEGKYEPARFPVPLGLKDIELALAQAGASAAPMPLASVIRDRLLSAVARGYQNLDWSVLGRVAAEDAGL